MNLETLIGQARELSTAEIADALDFFRLPGSALGIAPIAGPAKLAGQAFTVRFAPVDTATPGTVGDFLDDIPAGAYFCRARQRRPPGLHGVGRHHEPASRRPRHRRNGGPRRLPRHPRGRPGGLPALRTIALHAHGQGPRAGRGRWRPVTLSDVRVCPGDFVVGDADGVVVVPLARAGEVFGRALSMRDKEAQILKAALGGMKLSDARIRFGYHTLQRPA